MGIYRVFYAGGSVDLGADDFSITEDGRVPLLVAIAIGASATAVSPFSTGGAIMIASCPDKEMGEGLFNKALIMAIVAAALSAVLGLVGIYSI